MGKKEDFKKSVRKVYATSLAMSIVVGIMGIFFIFDSGFILNAISVVLGIVIIIPGIISIVEYLKNKKNFNIIFGVVSCIAGAIFIGSSKFVASILPFILGIYFAIMGVTKLQYSNELRKNNIKSYYQSLIAGIIALAVGVIIMINPFNAAKTMTALLGIVMVLYCAFDIYNTINVNKEIKNALVVVSKANYKNTQDEKEEETTNNNFMNKEKVIEASYEEKNK